jgi:hypothetical protein
MQAVAYFLVAEIPEQNIFHDSYVVPLIRSNDIAYARRLIRDGWHGWSWHVAEFLKFDPYGCVICQYVTPTQVEQGIDDWSTQGGLIIGFQSYTIVAEVGPTPLSLKVSEGQKEVGFYWRDLRTNYLYTLESKDVLGSQNWSPVEGTSWPARTNQFRVPRSSSNKFYRVTATASE